MKKEVLKPFDLEKAKEGAKVKTANGHNVRILSFNRTSADGFSIVGLELCGAFEEITCYTNEGKCFNACDERNLCIVEEVEEPERWRDKKNVAINGYFVNCISHTQYCEGQNTSNDYRIFAKEKQALSALAAARISQIIANDGRFGGEVTDKEWERTGLVLYTIILKYSGEIVIFDDAGFRVLLSFHTKKQAELFLEENRDLVEQYYMIANENE